MKKILLVDDSAEIRNLLRCMLEEEAYVFEVSSGFKAIDFLNQQRVDLIISDLEMLNGDGYWLLEKVKLIQDRPEVIILSNAIPLDKKKLKEAGAMAILSKPFQMKSLMDLTKVIT